MSMAIVTLKKGEGRTLKAGGAWIYDNEIESIMGNAENGEIVLVHDFDGYPLGRGFINRNSKIRVRMMTRHIDQEIDREFLKMRVKNAWDYRKTTVDTSSCRVIFGEADFLLMGNLIEGLFGVIERIFCTLFKGVARIILKVIQCENLCLRKRVMFADEHVDLRVKKRRENNVCISKGFVEYT